MNAVVIHVPNGLSYKLDEHWYDAGEEGDYYKREPRSGLQQVGYALGNLLACFHLRQRFIEERKLNPYEQLLYSDTEENARPWKKRVTINGLWVENFRRLDESIVQCLKAIEEYEKGLKP